MNNINIVQVAHICIATVDILYWLLCENMSVTGFINNKSCRACIVYMYMTDCILAVINLRVTVECLCFCRQRT